MENHRHLNNVTFFRVNFSSSNVFFTYCLFRACFVPLPRLSSLFLNSIPLLCTLCLSKRKKMTSVSSSPFLFVVSSLPFFLLFSWFVPNGVRRPFHKRRPLFFELIFGSCKCIAVLLFVVGFSLSCFQPPFIVCLFVFLLPFMGGAGGGILPYLMSPLSLRIDFLWLTPKKSFFYVSLVS